MEERQAVGKTASVLVHHAVLAICVLGLLNFGAAAVMWGVMVWVGIRLDEPYVDWVMLAVQAVPAAILFVCFVVSLSLRRKKLQVSVLLTATACLASITLFLVETRLRLYQLNTPIMHVGDTYYNLSVGDRLHYSNWPWYTDVRLAAEHRTSGPVRYGYIDKTGTLVIEPRFDSAGWFSEGLAAVETQGKWGFVDVRGRWGIEPQFEKANEFSEGLAPVRLGGVWGFIDARGDHVIHPQFQEAYVFSEGLARVKVGDRYGAVRPSGEYAIEPRYDFVGTFREGLAPVLVGERYGYINGAGQFVIDPSFMRAQDFSEGLAAVRVADTGKWGYIDKSGAVVVKPAFGLAFPYSDGFAGVRVVRPGWGYRLQVRRYVIDTDGEIVRNPFFETAGSFSESLATIEVDGKIGYVDRTGAVVIEPQFDEGGPFREGYARVGIRKDKP